jgi:hypothetical protein
MLQLAHTFAGGMNSKFDILNTHFHFNRLADSSMVPFHLGTLQIVFERIRQTIAFSDKHYREDAATPASRFADAPMGGFDFPDPTNRITFRTEYPDCGPMCRAAMIVHEGAHLCGKFNEINHFAHEFPLPDGKPQGAGHTRNYAQLLPEEAMKNASSYAAFAIHVTTGTDSRFGLDKKKV